MNFKLRGILFSVLGLSGFAAALLVRQFKILGIIVGFAFFIIGGTALGKANHVAQFLRPFVGRAVRVDVWGVPLPDGVECILTVDSAFAFGAGLWIKLHKASGGPSHYVKVAQPAFDSLNPDRIEIAGAAYVSWAGRRIKRAADKGVPALVLRVE